MTKNNNPLFAMFVERVNDKITQTAELFGFNITDIHSDDTRKVTFGTLSAKNESGYNVTVSASYAPTQFITLTVGPDHRPGLSFEFGSGNDAANQALGVCELLRNGMLDVIVDSAPL